VIRSASNGCCAIPPASRSPDPGYGRSGALAPAQAFDPASFLAVLADVGVSYEVD